MVSPASSSSMLKEERLSVKILSQIECSCPVDLLQVSGVGSKSTWFTSVSPSTRDMCPNSERCHDMTMEESESCSLMWQASLFLIKSCRQILRMCCRRHWSIASIRHDQTIRVDKLHLHDTERKILYVKHI